MFCITFDSSFSSSDSSIVHLFIFFIVSITGLFLSVVFAIDVVDDLKVEEDVVVKLMEMGKSNGGYTKFMFTGMNLL